MLKGFSVLHGDLKDMQCMGADESFCVPDCPIPLIQSILRILLMSALSCIVLTLGLWAQMLHKMFRNVKSFKLAHNLKNSVYAAWHTVVTVKAISTPTC